VYRRTSRHIIIILCPSVFAFVPQTYYHQLQQKAEVGGALQYSCIHLAQGGGRSIQADYFMKHPSSQKGKTSDCIKAGGNQRNDAWFCPICDLCAGYVVWNFYWFAWR
jgi:hypothetical protein